MKNPVTGSKDVTSQVEFGDIDSESLSLTKCVCGKPFASWGRIISIYPDLAKPCRECGRRFFFTVDIKVFEVIG